MWYTHNNCDHAPWKNKVHTTASAYTMKTVTSAVIIVAPCSILINEWKEK
jgi:hypothetical protein